MADVVLASTAHANMIDVPMWLQAVGGDAAIDYDADDHLRTLLDILTSEGVASVTDWKLSQRAAGANFSVDIATGAGFVRGDQVADQGKYCCRTTGVVNLGTPAAPVSGTRVHRVGVRVRDKQAVGTGPYDWTFETLEDTGSGTPAEPNSFLTIGTVSIAAGQASNLDANITDARPYATLLNFPPPVQVGYTTATGAFGSGSEGNLMGIGPFTFRANCAYRISWGGCVNDASGTPTRINIKIRKTDPAGPVWIDQGWTPVASGLVATWLGGEGFVRRNAGSDLSATFCVSGIVDTGTAVLDGTATQRRWCRVEYAGPASAYSGIAFDIT